MSFPGGIQAKARQTRLGTTRRPTLSSRTVSKRLLKVLEKVPVQPLCHNPRTLVDEPGCQADPTILSQLTTCMNSCIPRGLAQDSAQSRCFINAGGKHEGEE